MFTESLSPESFHTFGDLLKFFRRRERLTQLELSIKVGYSEAQISRLEQNQRQPDIIALKAVFIPALHLEKDPDLTERFLQLAHSSHQVESPAPGVAPYKGLTFFDRADAEIFFGRENLTAHLVERVTNLARQESFRFLAIVGASGSGKSSVVRAGLAVALEQLGWEICIITPTSSPLKALASQYNPSAENIGKPHLLFVDQFEETFTFCRDEKERSAFINKLLSIAERKTTQTTVVIALRSDFYSQCAQYSLLREAVASGQEFIGQMTTRELRRAIEEPARRGGWEFEPGLVDDLLTDIGAGGIGQPEPGALPLLSHALFATWERRRGRKFTQNGYHETGGVRGAIAQTAETVYTDHFTREQQAIARRIFLRLTELGDKTSTVDTRRRARFEELILKPEETSETMAVLKALADARLITTSHDSAEVTHEALIREWPTLRGWLEDNRESLRLHRHLTEAAQEWSAQQRTPDMFFRGTRLMQTREWASAHQDELNTLEREFLDVSIEQYEFEILEKEKQRQRELKAAQKLARVEQLRAEVQTHYASQMRQRAIYLAAASIITFFMTCTALSFSNQSDLNALAVLNARATALTNVENSSKILNTIMGKELLRLDEPTAQALLTAYSPNKEFVAARMNGKMIKVWDTVTGNLLVTLVGHADQITDIAFSPDGAHLASSSQDGTVIIWSMKDGKAFSILKGHNPAEVSVAFSPDGSNLLTACTDGVAIIWDVITGSQLVKLKSDGSSFNAATYNLKGNRIATADMNGKVQIWDSTTGNELLTLRSRYGRVYTVAYSPDGKWLVAVSSTDIGVWNADTGEILYDFAR
jgi:transcriptional regulator with XRE-family HTH domain